MLELSNAARECVLAPLEKSVQIATIRCSQKGPVASVDVELASEPDIELHDEPDIQPGVQLGMECPGAMPAMLATPAASPDNELVTAPGRVFGFLEATPYAAGSFRHSSERRFASTP